MSSIAAWEKVYIKISYEYLDCRACSSSNDKLKWSIVQIVLLNFLLAIKPKYFEQRKISLEDLQFWPAMAVIKSIGQVYNDAQVWEHEKIEVPHDDY